MAFTRDLRSAVSTFVIETGRPFVGHGKPFILTKNCRVLEKFTCVSWIFKVLERR